MTVEGWDILYKYFSGILGREGVGHVCVRFGDLCLVEKLIALGHYNELIGDRHQMISQECPLAVLQDFVAECIGYVDPLRPNFIVNGETKTEKCSRCYLVGKMAKSDDMAIQLSRELVKCVAHYLVMVYDPNTIGSSTPTLLSRTVESDDPWISRNRAFPTSANIDEAQWEVEWSVKNILQHILQRKWFKERNMSNDHYTFVVIDRKPGRTFTILDDVAVILARLSRNTSGKQIFEHAINATFPVDQGGLRLKEATILNFQPSKKDEMTTTMNYESHRTRAWDINARDPNFLHNINEGRTPTEGNVIAIRKSVAEMEYYRLITPLNRSESTHAVPMILQGCDGMDDMYLDYGIPPVDEKAFHSSCLATPEILNPQKNLQEFVEKFKATSPDAIFARGRIHTHYCAWPIRPLAYGAHGIPNFGTLDGYIFQWNVLPFDAPLVLHIWQRFVYDAINTKLSFACFVHTTFVIGARTLEEAEENIAKLNVEVAKHGWELSMPEPSAWVTDIAELQLSKLWAGVQPLQGPSGSWSNIAG